MTDYNLYTKSADDNDTFVPVPLTIDGSTNYRALGWLMHLLYDAGISKKDIIAYANVIGQE